jgi:hypothetical protein
MKIKNTKVFWGTILAFAIISSLNTFHDYKLNHDSKIGDVIKQKVEDITFEDIFTPTEREEILENRQKGSINGR